MIGDVVQCEAGVGVVRDLIGGCVFEGSERLRAKEGMGVSYFYSDTPSSLKV